MPSIYDYLVKIARVCVNSGKKKKEFMEMCRNAYDKAEDDWLREGM